MKTTQFKVGQELCLILSDKFVAGLISDIRTFDTSGSRFITVVLVDGRVVVGFSEPALLSKVALADEFLNAMASI